jgi:hypothetical protein
MLISITWQAAVIGALLSMLFATTTVYAHVEAWQ